MHTPSASRRWPRWSGAGHPARVEEVTGVPADQLRAAAAILGAARSLVSTVLQGVYQSMQATAAACQVNNLHLIRGMLGRPGCGLYQMNGQPTAQNTRECGADGDLPAFRNWHNPSHIAELARLWNVDPAVIPRWAPPTHAMQIFRYAEAGIDQTAVDQRHQSRRLAARTRPASQDPPQTGLVRHRAGRLPHRDRFTG